MNRGERVSVKGVGDVVMFMLCVQCVMCCPRNVIVTALSRRAE